MPVYVLDANVFIESKKRYYAFDIAPGFWNALLLRAAVGQIVSIDRVRLEIERVGDELTDWAKNNFLQFFESTADASVIQEYRAIMQWSQRQTQYDQSIKADFAQIADPWLVAYARSKGFVVVTEEVLNNGTRKKIPIPNVCVQFGVGYCNTFEMLRRLGVKLS